MLMVVNWPTFGYFKPKCTYAAGIIPKIREGYRGLGLPVFAAKFAQPHMQPSTVPTDRKRNAIMEVPIETSKTCATLSAGRDPVVNHRKRVLVANMGVPLPP